MYFSIYGFTLLYSSNQTLQHFSRVSGSAMDIAIFREASSEFSGGSEDEGSIVTAVARVTAVAQVQSLAWELLHAAGEALKKKKKKSILMPKNNFEREVLLGMVEI